MIIIGAKQLAVLCASHFVSHFDYSDLETSVYHSDYEVRLEGTDYVLWCEARFNDGWRAVTDFHYGILPALGESTTVEVTGESRQATDSALNFINSYLNEYKIMKTTL